MKNLKFILAFTFLVTTFTQQVLAQPYPITTTTQLATPQLPQLETLADPTNNTVFLSLVLNDVTQPTYNLRLRMVISGNGIQIETDPQAFVPSPIALQYNVPVLLNGADLAEYFKLDNLRFSGISREEYLQLGTLPEGLYSVCFEAYDYNRFLEPPVSNRSCATSNLETHDPPVIINPIGELPLTTPQQLQFNWQNRHIGAFPVEYELRIYEKRAGLTDDQILASMPPIFRVNTKLPTYSYGLKDPLLKEAQEYLIVVNVRDLMDKNYFKNLGNSKPETFVLKTPCRPGLACSDNDDCTTNDTYDADCNCVGMPIYDADDNGTADPITLPAPTIVKPNNEICVDNGKSVIAWTPNHHIDIPVEYELSIWLDKIDITQTKEYLSYQKEYDQQWKDFLAKQKEEYSIFVKEQQAETEKLAEELKVNEAACLAKVKQSIADFETQQAEEAIVFATYLKEFSANCDADKIVLEQEFFATLANEKAAFDKRQKAEKAELEEKTEVQRRQLLEDQKQANADFFAQQAKDLAAFEAELAQSNEARQAQLATELADMKSAETSIEEAYQTCFDEANNFKKSARTDYLASIAPLQKEIGLINLVIQNLKANFVDTRLKLKEQLAKDLSNAQNGAEKQKIRSAYKSAVAKARTEFKTDLATEKAKKEPLKAEISAAKTQLKTTLADAAATITALKETCETEHATALKNLEEKETSMRNAVVNNASKENSTYDAFVKKQAAEADEFKQLQAQERAAFEEKMNAQLADFSTNQKLAIVQFQEEQAAREKAFYRQLSDCQTLIAQESAYFQKKQSADKLAFDKKIKESTATCSAETQLKMEKLEAEHQKQLAEFTTKQSAELTQMKKAMDAKFAVLIKALEDQYSKGLPKLVYTNELDSLYQHILPEDYPLVPGNTYSSQVKATVECSLVTIENKGLSIIKTFVITKDEGKTKTFEKTMTPDFTKTQNQTKTKTPNVLPPTNLTTSSFQANWEEMEMAEYYILEVATDKNFTHLLPAYAGVILPTSTTSYLVENLKGTDFFYRIRGGNNCVLLDFSTPISVSTEGAPPCLYGTPCDDKDPCTIDDTISKNCECRGTYSGDSDGDTVCDELDICPGFDDLIDNDEDGAPDLCDNCDGSCNDGDVTTINDQWVQNPDLALMEPPAPNQLQCVCQGTPVEELDCTLEASNDTDEEVQTLSPDSDGDGVCDKYDVCPGEDDLLDENENGIPDCTETDDEPDCPEDVSLLLHYLKPCDYCADLIIEDKNCQSFIKGIQLQLPGANEPIFLNADSNAEGFSFPYCTGFEDVENSPSDNFLPCVGQNTTAFANDLKNWASAVGQNLEIEILTTDNPCTRGVSGIEIKNSTIQFDWLQLGGCSATLSEQPSSYRLFKKGSCNTEDAAITLLAEIQGACDNPTFLWTTGATRNAISITENPESYGVTVTCEDGCEYTSANDLLCIIGAPCDDLDPCTINDIIIDANCACIGTYLDSDGDGLCDGLDDCVSSSNRHTPPIVKSLIGENAWRADAAYPFEWEALHEGDFEVVYTLRIYKAEAGVSPTVTVAQGEVLFSIETSDLEYVYTTANPVFELLDEYIIEIQAADPTGTECFDNDGKSELVTFYLKDDIVAISGIVETPDYGECVPVAVQGVKIELLSNGEIIAETYTDEAGNYTFPNVSKGEDYIIRASKEIHSFEEATCGLDIEDLDAGRDIILQLNPSENPYQILASDLNSSNDLTTFDLAIIGKIVYNLNELCILSTKIWEFVDGNHVFSDPQNPFADMPTATEITLTNLTESTDDANFVGIKKGDIACSVSNDCIHPSPCSFSEGYADINGDGTLEYCDCPDCDGDGTCDEEDICPGYNDNDDIDGDGIPDMCDDELCTNTEGTTLTPCEAVAAFYTCPNIDSETQVNDMERVSRFFFTLLQTGSAGIEDGTATVELEGDAEEFTLTNTGTDFSALFEPGNILFGTEQLLKDGDNMADNDDDGIADLFDRCPCGDDKIDVKGINGNVPDGIPDACQEDNGDCKAIDCSTTQYGAYPDINIRWDLILYFMFDRNCVLENDPCFVEGLLNCACECVPAGEMIDSDGDGVCDAEDKCPNGDDALDEDGDGIPNSCDEDPCETSGPCPPEGATCVVFAQRNSETCECEIVYDADDDEDGVCNQLDVCHGSHDTEDDMDEDGIPDGCDLCPTTPLNLGVPCDDGNDCTTGDAIQYLYETQLLSDFMGADYNDLDDKLDIGKVAELTGAINIENIYLQHEVDTAFNLTGEINYYVVLIDSCYCAGESFDSDYDGVCDVYDICPDFPDPIFEDGDGNQVFVSLDDLENGNAPSVPVNNGAFADFDNDYIPDGCDPPLYDIPCPTAVRFLTGFYKGVILEFSGHDFEPMDFPDPISFDYLNQSYTTTQYENIRIANVSFVTSTGNTEVLYEIPDLDEANLIMGTNTVTTSDPDPEPLFIGEVRYSAGQTCTFNGGDGTTNPYVRPFECPDEIGLEDDFLMFNVSLSLFLEEGDEPADYGISVFDQNTIPNSLDIEMMTFDLNLAINTSTTYNVNGSTYTAGQTLPDMNGQTVPADEVSNQEEQFELENVTATITGQVSSSRFLTDYPLAENIRTTFESTTEEEVSEGVIRTTTTTVTDIAITTINGNFTFDTGLACAYTDGEIDEPYTNTTTGTNCYIGQPCDDENPQTYYDVYVDDECTCQGEIIHDADNDGIHDDLDECPGGDDDLDENNNGIPDHCDCPSPAVATRDYGDGIDVELITIENDNDLKIVLKTNTELDPDSLQGPQNDHISYTVTWTPETTPEDQPNGSDSQPLTVSENVILINNLAGGTDITVTIVATCASGYEAAPFEITTSLLANEPSMVCVPYEPGPLECNEPGGFQPVENIYIGDQITAAGFSLTITDVLSSDASGGFAGSAFVNLNSFVPIPVSAPVPVEFLFENLVIEQCGTEYIVKSGDLFVLRDPNANLDAIFGAFAGSFELGGGNALENLGEALVVLKGKVEDLTNTQGYYNDVHDIMNDVMPLLPNFPFLDDNLIPPLQDAINCMASVDPNMVVTDPANPPAGSFEACQDAMEAALAALITNIQTLYESDYQVPFYEAEVNEGVVTYGFDAQEYQAHEEHYDHVEAVAKEPYSVAWKSVETGKKDRVNAKRADGIAFTPHFYFNDVGENDIPNSVTVPDNPGDYPNPITPSPSVDAGHAQIEITGQSSDKSVQEIFAVQPKQECTEHDHNDDGTYDAEHLHLAGKLNVISYEKKEVKLQLVKVNGDELPNLPSYTDIEKDLDKVYQQAVTDVVMVSDYIDLEGVPLPSEDFPNVPSGWLSAYTSDMSAIINKFRNTSIEIDEDTYYIFLLPITHETRGIRGFMPRKRNFGFVFINTDNGLSDGTNAVQADLSKTIAHELGHGAFRLQHTWKDHDNPEVGENKTNNLMDYGLTGTHLRKYQWDLVQDPEGVFTLFDEDEDGQSATVSDMTQFDEFRNTMHSAATVYNSLTFLAPSGLPITLPANVSSVSFNTGDEISVGCIDEFEIYGFGTLRSFTLDNKEYTIALGCNSTNFQGYAANGIYYLDTISTTYIASGTITKAIIGMPCLDGKNIIFNVGKISFPTAPTFPSSSPYKAGGVRANFDFLVESTFDANPEPKQMTVSMFPEYSAEAQHFLENIGFRANCGDKSVIYYFAHAHQISQYPGFYSTCHEDIADQSFGDLYKRLRNISATMDALNFNTSDPAVTAPYFKKAEIDIWKNREASIYKEYATTMQPNFISSILRLLVGVQYSTPINPDDVSGLEAKEVIEWLGLLKYNSCAFKNLSWDNRRDIINILSVLELTENNIPFIDKWGDDELEHLFVYIVKTTPEIDHENLLSLFETDSYALYFNVVPKLLDVFIPENLDGHGYEDFVSYISKLVLTVRKRTIESATPKEGCVYSLPNGQAVIHPCYEIDGQTDQPFIGIHFQDGWDLTCDYDYHSSYYHYPTVNNPPSPLPPNRVGLFGTLEVDDCDYDESTVAVKNYSVGAKPFTFIPIYNGFDIEFDTPDGKKIFLKKGETYIMPFCLADLVFRKIHDEQFQLSVSRTSFVVSLTLSPFSLISTAATTGLRILTVGDVLLTGVDAFVMAPTNYELQLTDETTLPIAQEIIDDWNNALGIWGLANAGWLVKQIGPGIWKISAGNTRAVLNKLHETATSYQHYKELRDQYVALYSSLYLRVKSATNDVEILKYLKAQSSALRFTNNFEAFNPNSIDDLIFMVERGSSNNYPRVYGKYLNNDPVSIGVLEPAGELNNKLIPDNWAASDIQDNPNFALLGTRRKQLYLNQSGETVTGDLSIYREFNTGKLYAKAGYILNDSWIAANPNLIDFYTLYNDTRNWGQHWDDMASFINELDAEKRNVLYGIFAGEAFKGSGGEAAMATLRGDMFTNSLPNQISIVDPNPYVLTNNNFRNILGADVKKIRGWAVLEPMGISERTNLDNHLFNVNAYLNNNSSRTILSVRGEITAAGGYQNWLTSVGETLAGRVDNVWLSTKEKQVLSRFKGAGFDNLNDANVVRTFRQIVIKTGTNETTVKALLHKTVVNYDVVRLEYLVDRIVGNDLSKLSSTPTPNFWSQAVLNTKFVKYIDDYLPAFQQNPINSVRPNQIGITYEFKDINMQHILDKHTLEHFDFANQSNYGTTVNMFPIGTTQQQVCNYIDEALDWLKTNKGSNYPLDDMAEVVLLENGMEVIIGSQTLNGQRVIGQFYPKTGLGIESFSQNDLLAIKKILE